MTLLKKRWRDTKDDHCKATHCKIESEKIIIIRRDIVQQMVPYKITPKHSAKQDRIPNGTKDWKCQANIWNP